MAASEKEDIPMLRDARFQSSDKSSGVELRRSNYSRSTSMLALQSATNMSFYEDERNLVSHTAPLRNEKRAPLVPNSGPLFSNGRSEIFLPFSGPLYTNSRPENSVIHMNRLLSGVLPAIRSEEYPEVNGVSNKDDTEDGFAGRNEHLMKSGLLGRCNDPFCTTCPIYFDNPPKRKYSTASSVFDAKLHSAYGDAKDWVTRSISFFRSYIPGVINPHAKDHKCIVLDWTLATVIACVRSVTDFIYFLHMLLQFRLAYVAPESRLVGAGDLVDHPKKIARHYLHSRFFWIDLFVVLPLPQILILGVLPKYVQPGSANYAKNMLRAVILLQYVPRMSRFIPLLAGQSPNGFLFETAWANFVINLFIFVLAGHVVGSCWYLFGLQRVNQCLRDACKDSKIAGCPTFIDCGRSNNNIDEYTDNSDWKSWNGSSFAINCFDIKSGSFQYGIYGTVVSITTQGSIITRYIYSLFWGFQQISTLAGNQTPSSFVGEVLFTMAIIGLGLLLFALLIGNMQNFLQGLGRRRLEMQLRRRDVEQWMSHRRLPEQLRRRVRKSERFNWAATRGVNEEQLIENLPEDLQRDIRQHLFKFIKEVRIFTLMDDDILDAICERLRQKLYIEGSQILRCGSVIEQMFFIVRGKLEVTWEESGYSVPLSEGDVFGEELLTWCLEQTSVDRDVRKIRSTGHRLFSSRTVTCLSNVEAFSLHVNDLEEVTALFARLLRNPRVQRALRYQSPYWRALAATHIQVAWRYRKRRQSARLNSSLAFHCA
ncbi:probable cyclic nucleotide-gated ion channel 20, chloroplastic isoform X2 [Nymphaea colorata]|uniref:probable cyclic nucleotide-gated ion channel 20, chloroplastic isoform X2 n=1 Tax=Nymphaea colorata TaxID=210225 RepID=UPI00129D94E6|nr:probable cyclic nucleotide-gated ion channel 20, chloroplastic isoform X2 [Nymphaea colorata]